ncbi:MAG TPA: oligopeptide/dipeptide ABC transporter ATP-binding protein, partial [Acidimicrobiales bacterium]|nr:oligopeptide/dipeptide ABC transporter ATP-binding protein [Acidimicrobiales bacterium]
VEDPQLVPTANPDHCFACFYPVGTAEGDAARDANAATGVSAAGLELRALRDRLVAADTQTAQEDDGDVLLRVEDLVVEYRAEKGKKVHAVSGVSFDVRRGETLGLVGESGCGKSTTGRAIMMLNRPTSGEVVFEDAHLTKLRPGALRQIRRRLQMIFQDPISSLNERRKVRDIVAEGLSITGVPKPWDARVDEALLAVGLNPAVIGNRRPRSLSGGQCQRVAIARALLLDPALVVCDEPVSALDVSVQAQILNLLHDMKERYSLTLVFIAHDLAVVKNVCDRVAVMYLGKICEIAPSDQLYSSPEHPYTQALMSAIPEPDPFTGDPPMLAAGELPSPVDPPSGCRFRTRCPRAQERCAVEEPAISPAGPDHWVACHFPGLIEH